MSKLKRAKTPVINEINKLTRRGVVSLDWAS